MVEVGEHLWEYIVLGLFDILFDIVYIQNIVYFDIVFWEWATLVNTIGVRKVGLNYLDI